MSEKNFEVCFQTLDESFDSPDADFIKWLMFSPEKIVRYAFSYFDLQSYSPDMKIGDAGYISSQAKLYFDLKGACIFTYNGQNTSGYHVSVNPKCDVLKEIRIGDPWGDSFAMGSNNLVPVEIALPWVEEFASTGEISVHSLDNKWWENWRVQRNAALEKASAEKVKAKEDNAKTRELLSANRISVSPHTVVEVDFKGIIGSGSPRWGTRFSIADENGQVEIFDGPNRVGGFELDEDTFEYWSLPQIHPTKDIAVGIIVGDDGGDDKFKVNFYDFSGQKLHSFTAPRRSGDKLKPAFGFDENGAFFCAVAKPKVKKEVYELLIWAADTPLKQIGVRNRASAKCDLGNTTSVVNGESQIQNSSYCWRNRKPYEEKIRLFWYRNGQIEFEPTITLSEYGYLNPIPGSAEDPICFSPDYTEFVTTRTFEDDDRSSEIRKHDNRAIVTEANDYGCQEFEQKGQSVLWPTERRRYPEDYDRPDCCIYIDPARVLFQSHYGILYVLHTRSMTLETELEIVGFEIDSVTNKSDSATAAHRGFWEFREDALCSDIDLIRRCGNDLLIIAPSEGGGFILAFVELSEITNLAQDAS